MIPDFPIDIRIRLAELKKKMLLPAIAKSERQKATKKSIVPILFLCYEESRVPSNLNSKQLRFYGVRPNVHITILI